MKNKEHEIAKTLNSLDGAGRARAGDFFFTRLQARLQQKGGSAWERVTGWIARPSVAIIGLLLILLLNGIIVVRQLKQETPVADQASVQAFAEALKTAPDQSKIQNNLGLALAKLGRESEALEAFKHGGDEAKAYNNLGIIYLGEQRYQEAIAAFERAVQLSPSYYPKAN